MKNENQKIAFRMLVLISAPRLTKKALKLFDQGRIPFQYQCRALGTASSEIMDMLGLGSVDKDLLLSVMPKPFADIMLKKLKKQLRLGMTDSGVAFSIPLTAGSGVLLRMSEYLAANQEIQEAERNENMMKDSGYAMIMAIVDQGYSEEVMEAARPLGASGGTVFHSRRIGSEEATRFWGIRVQQEREIVMILVRKEDKKAIMKAIGEKCGLKSEAHGFVMSVPVDGIEGID